MTTPDDVLAAVRSKQQRDEAQVADLIRRGANLPAARSFADGGMHPTFAAAVSSHNVDEDGVVRTPGFNLGRNDPGQCPHRADRRTACRRRARPRRPRPAASASRWFATPARPRRLRRAAAFFGNLFSSSSSSSSQASAAPASSGGGVMDRMARMVGLGGSSSTEKAAPAPKAKPAPSKQTAKAKADEKKPTKQTANAGAIRPKSEPSEQQTAQAPASNPGVISGAQPTVPTGAFDNRFGAWR